MRSFISLCILAVCGFVADHATAAPISFPSMKEIAAGNAKLADYKALHRLVDNKQKPILWLFLGDSITHGAWHTNGYRCFSEHWREIMKWEPRKNGNFRRTNDIVINCGVSGETATGFLNHVDWRLKQFKPQVVLINFGINDADKIRDKARFRADLTQIVKLVRVMKAIPVLQTPSLTLEHKPSRAEFAQIVREVAAKEKALLVDHASYWKELSGSEECPAAWMNNTLHPNYLGHRVMVRALAFELGFWDKDSPTLKLPVEK